MKRKVNLLIIILVILFLSVCFCMVFGLRKLEISDSYLKVVDLITTQYSEEDLKYMSSLDYSLKDYNKKYQIECLKIENDLYKLVYYGDSGYLYIL